MTTFPILMAAIFTIPFMAWLSPLSNYILRNVRIRWTLFILLLTIAGFGLLSFASGDLHPSQFMLYLTPGCQFSFMIASFIIFTRKMAREPRDVIFNFNSGYAVDRFYSMANFATFAPPMFMYDFLGGLEKANGI